MPSSLSEATIEQNKRWIPGPPWDIKSDVRFKFYSYLQHWRLFWPIKDRIKAEFALAPSLQRRAKAIVRHPQRHPRPHAHASEASTTAAVFLVVVHERSGDMGHDALAKIGCPTDRYRHAAFHYFIKKHAQQCCKFVVVAQDPEYTAKDPFFAGRNDTVVLPQAPLPNRAKDQGHHHRDGMRDEPLDLAIMAEADGVILSAGTYSWWGGFLNGKDVVYCDNGRRGYKSEFYPDEWTGLPGGTNMHRHGGRADGYA